ncbi:hydroxysqualene dehydroxylase HpnE [Silvimonas amylolytica]|uniref:Amine oxidoreductase n=1 Tax=Silvimonas amylolytica TaxID=449663 RepID=A0ABQ2PSQ8_9NEIS|nr:hydroxysqualene dehydroxylase HpnE [Silvimonas amylolytica]GGP28275.1 amine oxidoreductase [Silvimonas amylolytica]
MSKYSVAVVGGGYAGMAAAVRAAHRGASVSVFEAGPVLGGRARRISIDGRRLDNGQHLLIGAYSALLDLMRQVGVDLDDAFLRTPLDLKVQPDFHLRCPSLPAPLHLAAGLLSVKGLSWTARGALIRLMLASQLAGWTLKMDQTVAQWLKQNRQPEDLIVRFWQPLTVAALNTPIETASAQILLNVLRDSLGGGRAASDLLFPRIDFSALFPEPAGEYIAGRGGKVETGVSVTQLQRDGDQWQINDRAERFDGVVIALPPHRLSMLTDENGAPLLVDAIELIERWEFQPIVTLYYQYPAETRLPQPMLGCSGGLCQWVFDRGQTHGDAGLIAVVLSAKGVHSNWPQAELADRVAQELEATFGWSQPISHRVISEKRATFACTPDLIRPGNATKYPSLWLAGDYTALDYPATLEGAVRSGLQAADGLLAALN